MKIIVGITGASGSIYGLKLIEVLKNAGHQVHVVISDSGLGVIQYECDTTLEDIALVADKIYNVHNVGAAIASGSFQADAMVIAPCSMNTCGCLANGITENLLTRAADVMLKEGRKLVIVPREAPMHAGHLENLLKLSRMGATIIPASPGFYHRPDTIMDLVNMLVGKICDNLGVKTNLFQRWTVVCRNKIRIFFEQKRQQIFASVAFYSGVPSTAYFVIIPVISTALRQL